MMTFVLSPILATTLTTSLTAPNYLIRAHRLKFFSLFQTSGGLKNHLKTHNEERNSEKVCEVCGKIIKQSEHGQTSSLTYYQWHMRQHKKPPREKHECKGNGCDETFASKRKRSAHESICEYVVHKCEYCDKIFPRSQLLGRHKPNCLRRPR